MNIKAEQDSTSPTSSAQPALDCHTISTPALTIDGHSLPALARRAVETYVLKRLVYVPNSPTLSTILQQAAGCFVTIKTFDRELRGCIGTITPTQLTLADEIIVNAISAATRDPRFQPISTEELTQIHYSIDVLDKLEPTNFEDLDPRIFGVIVEDETGSRRGVLLPQIKGIESAEQQVKIAARKADISIHQSLRLFRFRVLRFSEGKHTE